MNEYDPERAKAELRRVDGMTSESAKRLAVAVISAATFIDIAESLRIIAREAELAMDGAFLADVSDDVPGAEPVSFEIGDRVTIGEGDAVFKILDFGVDQDTPYAKISDGEGEFRVWVESLSHADAALPNVNEAIEPVEDGEYKPTEAELAAHEAEKYGAIDQSAEADDEDGPEADFPDPLEALKKHTKKGKKK